MKAARIQELINKYNAMSADPAELREIEQLIAGGAIDLSDLKLLAGTEDALERMETPLPSSRLDDTFYRLLDNEKGRVFTSPWYHFFTGQEWRPRMAFAAATLLIGLALGFLLRTSPSGDGQIQELSQEISNLKELVMLSLLEKESATDRLKAVNLTHEMDQASQNVTSALLQTLNHDENVNVRLAALDALKAYGQDSKVREALIRSISRQESPLVQISLAEVMVLWQAKSSVGELKKIVNDENTPADVRKKIEETISVLI